MSLNASSSQCEFTNLGLNPMIAITNINANGIVQLFAIILYFDLLWHLIPSVSSPLDPSVKKPSKIVPAHMTRVKREYRRWGEETDWQVNIVYHTMSSSCISYRCLLTQFLLQDRWVTADFILCHDTKTFTSNHSHFLGKHTNAGVCAQYQHTYILHWDLLTQVFFLFVLLATDGLRSVYLMRNCVWLVKDRGKEKECEEKAKAVRVCVWCV